MSPSSMTVKKPLFDLYENRFVPLNKAIRPAFNGLLQGLLPGLEEGSEFYDRANSLLEMFCSSVEPIYFYTSLWEVMLQGPSVRIYGTTFLITHFDKRKNVEEQLYIFGNNINLMLNSISQLLNDNQALVQRQALDFVLAALKMHKSQLTLSDREKLCSACLSVLLRRDMSLNRRFYNWLLGSHLEKAILVKLTMDDDNEDSFRIPDSDLQMKYFKNYSKSVLISAIKLVIRETCRISYEKRMSVKPFRIIMTLIMDRSEIGGEIIEDVLFDLILYMEVEYFELGKQLAQQPPVQEKSELKKLTGQEEFLKTANLFFANLDSGFFWNYINNLFEITFNNELTPSQIHNDNYDIDRICELVIFMLSRLPIETYSEVHSRHLPKLLHSLTKMLIEHVGSLAINSIRKLLQIYQIIFDQIIQHVSKYLYEENVSITMETDSHKTKHITGSCSPLDKISKIIQTTIYNFREFSRKFSLFKLGYNNEEIEKCAYSILKSNNRRNHEDIIDSNSLILNVRIDSTTIEVYSIICHMLVEMTSYPIHTSSKCLDFSIFQEEEKAEAKCENNANKLPKWLICLIMSACFVKDYRLKSEAMSTLLDLIESSRSVFGFKNQNNPSKKVASIKKHMFSMRKQFLCSDQIKGDDKSNELAVLSINFPVLAPEVMSQIDNSRLYLMAGLSLWHYLSSRYPHCHQRSVDLIHRLHQTAPSPNICEDMILQKLLSDSSDVSLDAHKRFILLWQLLAKNRLNSSLTNTTNVKRDPRHFDKCMLVLLDGLDNNDNGNEVINTMCLSWLESAFQNGHANFILTPLILNTLKPDTARISLQSLVTLSASKHSQDNQNGSDSKVAEEESRIYAISNEGGNVKYHLKPKTINDNSKSNETYNNRNNDEADGNKLLLHCKPEIPTDSEVMNIMDEVMTSVVSDKVIEECSDHNSNNECEIEDINNGKDSIDTKDYSITTETEDETAVEVNGDEDINTPQSDISKLFDHINDYIQPVHNHFLIYCSIFDSACVLYSLSRIKVIIRKLSGLFISVIHNLIPSDPDKVQTESKNDHEQRIFELLTRHSNALLGNNFYQSPTADDIIYLKKYNCLDIILLICGWFMCSYYPTGNCSMKLSENDFYENKKVQMVSMDLIDLIIKEMLSILQVGYVNYRGDFVSKTCTSDEIKKKFRATFDLCNIAKVTLHGMATSTTRPDIDTGILSDSIVYNNEHMLDNKIRDSYQIALMRLVLNVLKLDYGLNSSYVLSVNMKLKETLTISSNTNAPQKTVMTEARLPSPQVLKNLFMTYYNNSKIYVAVSRQSILLTSVVACLGAKKLRHLHTYCYGFLISSLGVWGQSTSAVLVPVVRRLCKNIKLTAETFEEGVNKENKWDCTDGVLSNEESNEIVLDYAITTLECLKAICHFLLLDEALKSYQIQEEKGTSSEHSLLGSLFSRSKETTMKEDSKCPSTHILEARQNMLRLMPRVIHSILSLWEGASISETRRGNDQIPSCWIMGKPEKIYSIILGIIKPLMKQHAVTILISIARVWPHLDQFLLSNEVFKDPSLILNVCVNKTLLSIFNESNREQYRTLCILTFARGWKNSFPLEKIICTCKDIIRKPFPVHTSANISSKKLAEKEEILVKVNLLEFLQCLLATQSAEKLSKISGSFSLLLKEINGLVSSTGSLILLKILSDFLGKVPIPDDRKEQRDLQDLCHKIIEHVAILAGSSLEQPTWFRRAAQVRLQDEPVESSDISDQKEENGNFAVESVEGRTANDAEPRDELVNYQEQNDNLGVITENSKETVTKTHLVNSNSAALQDTYKMTTLNTRSTPSSKTLTIQALQLLTLHLASILDVIYKSEEKERVLPFINSIILPNVLPYLRFRSLGNVLNLRVASQLLASLSSYQHMRKSWRKEIFDLYLETYFFQMDLETLKYWKIIIDNLMTQDKSTFREAFTKLTVTQSSGLNLFSSKEAEYELTAVCLKKLAFIVYSSEPDQYLKSMPEIQERLSDSLRLGMIPQVYNQLFLCFRVLLLRMSDQPLISFWYMLMPVIISSIQSLIDHLKIEEDPKSQKFQEIQKYLPMYLSMAKVLDLILLMPEENCPQFLYYKWAFIGYVDDSNGITNDYVPSDFTPSFQPLLTVVMRSYIEHFMSSNIPIQNLEISWDVLHSGRPILFAEAIHSLGDLAFFFVVTCLRNVSSPEKKANEYGISIVNKTYFDDNKRVTRTPSLKNEAELILDNEFIEPLNNKL